MNCQNFETVVNDLARNQMMEASAREQATLHCDECHSCSVRLHAEQRLTASLRELAAEFRSANTEGAPARVQHQLMAEFRSHSSAVKARQGSRSAYWSYAGIAALFLVVLGIGATRLFVSVPPESQAENNAIKTVAPDLNAAPELSPAPENVVVGIQPRQPKRSPKSTAVVRREGTTTIDQETLSAGNLENEVTTDFYPVSYSSALSVQDGGQVVRVELPRSAMARFGVPVNMDRYDERVKADVLVGADGLARAIRFVQSRDK